MLPILARLHDKSMLVADPAAEEARFRLLEPLRQYGRERLAEVADSIGYGPTTPRTSSPWPRRPRGRIRATDRAAWLARLDHAPDDIRSGCGCASATEAIQISDWG